ncbi:MAG: type II toxin-antitoxin system Phd/YefM family antitoxin [Rhodanobacteraceae bacterium]
MDTITVTELRQRLFQLADHVAATGEPLVIVRNGVRLKLIREEEAPQAIGRLSRLVQRSIVIGPPLDPHESPAEWTGLVDQVAEPFPDDPEPKPPRNRKR